MSFENNIVLKDDKTEIDELFNNLDLILNKKDLILSNQDFYSVKIKGVGAGGVLVGGITLLLGDLLTLWEYGNWHIDNKYYFYITGSPLSGSNVSRFYDDIEHKIYSEPFVLPNGRQSWGELGFAAFNYIQHGSFTYEDKSVICSGWREKHKQSKFTIFDLIKYLNKI